MGFLFDSAISRLLIARLQLVLRKHMLDLAPEIRLNVFNNAERIII